MKTVLLSILLCVAVAAPAEDKKEASEAAAVTPKKDVAAPPEMEDKMMTKDQVFVPVLRNALMSVEETAPESRFNFCPDGWFSHGPRCFLFVNSPMSWYSAEEHCNALGAHLASATNPREYKFLQQMTQTAGQSIAWLGGFNLQGQWMWIDREAFYYTNFESSSSSSSFPCIYLRPFNGWGNTRCSYNYRFICSKNPFSC